MIIKNAKVYSDSCRFVEKDLIIRDGRIVFGAAPQEGEEVIDAGGAYALPGLVDIHFHGAVGHDSATPTRPACRPSLILRRARACWPSAPQP